MEVLELFLLVGIIPPPVLTPKILHSHAEQPERLTLIMLVSRLKLINAIALVEKKLVEECLIITLTHGWETFRIMYKKISRVVQASFLRYFYLCSEVSGSGYLNRFDACSYPSRHDQIDKMVYR